MFRELTCILLALLTGGSLVAAPAPPGAALPPGVALELHTEAREDGPYTYFTYTRADGKPFFEGRVPGEGLDALDAFLPDLAALLAPESAVFDRTALVQLAYDTFDATAFPWSLELQDDAPYDSFASPYFTQTSYTLRLNTGGGRIVGMRHASHTAPDGTPLSFADLFTVPQAEAEDRVLALLWAQAPYLYTSTPEELAVHFDPERFYAGRRGLEFWYPSGVLSARTDMAEFTIPYDSLGDVLKPVSGKPLFGGSGGFEVYYLTAADGSLLRRDSLSGYSRTAAAEHPRADLFGGRYFLNSALINGYQSPAWASIGEFYRAEFEGLEAYAERRAKELFEASEHAGTWVRDYEELDVGVSYQGEHFVSITQHLSPSFGGEAYVESPTLTSSQVFDHAAGAPVPFGALFTDPAEARRRTVEYLSSATGLSSQRVGALFTPYRYYLGGDGVPVLYCSAYDLGTASQWPPQSAQLTARMAEFEAIGVPFTAAAEEFPLPAGLLSDLMKPL